MVSKTETKFLVPATTWVTNVGPVIQNGLQPIFCDINLNNFSFDIEDLKYVATQHPDIKVVFITHLIGLSSDVEKIEDIFPNALVLEDICESHGVQGPSLDKRGTLSAGSTFSFYFGHHITTIEVRFPCHPMRSLHSHQIIEVWGHHNIKQVTVVSHSQSFPLMKSMFQRSKEL